MGTSLNPVEPQLSIHAAKKQNTPAKKRPAFLHEWDYVDNSDTLRDLLTAIMGYLPGVTSVSVKDFRSVKPEGFAREDVAGFVIILGGWAEGHTFRLLELYSQPCGGIIAGGEERLVTCSQHCSLTLK